MVSIVRAEEINPVFEIDRTESIRCAQRP